MFALQHINICICPALSIPRNSHPPTPDTGARSWNHAQGIHLMQIYTYSIFIFILELRRIKWALSGVHDIDIRWCLTTFACLSVCLSVYLFLGNAVLLVPALTSKLTRRRNGISCCLSLVLCRSNTYIWAYLLLRLNNIVFTGCMLWCMGYRV